MSGSFALGRPPISISLMFHKEIVKACPAAKFLDTADLAGPAPSCGVKNFFSQGRAPAAASRFSFRRAGPQLRRQEFSFAQGCQK